MAPSGRRATTSVNVPPRSIQNCHLAMGERFAQLRDETQGERDARGIERHRLRRELGDDQLIRAIDEEILAMDADAKDEWRRTFQDVPLAAIAHRQAGEIRGEAARVPRASLAVALDVGDPGRGLLE